MLRVFYLFWTLITALIVTGLGYFYIRDEGRHGFPFAFATEVQDGVASGDLVLSFNALSLGANILFWWFLFSILLIAVKNYVFESE